MNVEAMQTLPKLKAKLDKVFSLYIRLRDSNDHGYGRCVTCHRVVFWKEADAGHFMTRNLLGTRFHPYNVHLQCKGCNGPRGGLQYAHGLRIDEIHGEGWASKLQVLSKQSARITRQEYESQIKHYTEAVEELKRHKTLA